MEGGEYALRQLAQRFSWSPVFIDFSRKIRMLKAAVSIFFKKVLFGRDLRWKRYFLDRLGIYNPDVLEGLKRKHTLLIYANSGGEAFGIEMLCNSIRKQFPDFNIVIATDNFQPYNVMKKGWPWDAVVFFPWDFNFLIKRFVKKMRIMVVVYLVRLLHPNFINLCRKNGIKQMMIDGYFRMQDFNYDEFNSFIKPVIANDCFRKMDLLLMKSQIDTDNLKSLEIAPDRVITAGSIKSDLSYAVLSEVEKRELRTKLGISNKNPVIVAGSTITGEEKIILDAFEKILEKYPSAKLVLVPRWWSVSGKTAVHEAMKRGLACEFYSNAASKGVSGEWKVMLVDVFGVLAKLYSIATLAILGDTFYWPGGGHNILEPMVNLVPVVFGKYNFGYTEFITPMVRKYPLLQLSKKEKLADVLLRLLRDKRLRNRIGRHNYSLIPDNRKVIRHYMNYIAPILKKQNA